MTRPATILVVDDSPVVVEAVKGALQGDGLTVVTATDGLEAIDMVKLHHVDLILLDIDMPRMNGYQVCKLLKNDPKFRDIPIIMLTAKTSEADRLWGIKAGSDEYITKPFDYNKVKEALKRFL